MIKIDIDTRCWQIPKEEAFLGVESDDKVRILKFELSKNEFCNSSTIGTWTEITR